LRFYGRKIPSRRPGLHGYLEGSLYPALHRMEEAGWIRTEWITKDGGRRARVYELTAAGKPLAIEETNWHTVAAAIKRVLRTV